MSTTFLAILLLCPSLAVATPGGPTMTIELQRLGPVAVGQPTPWFAGADARAPERAINLKRLLAEQQPIALVFFATWCSPCRVGLRRLVEHADALERANVRVVLVDYREPQERVLPFVNELKLGRFPVILDKFGVVARSFGVAEGDDKVALPRTFVILRDGKVAAIFAEEAEDYVARIMAAAASGAP